MQTECLHLEGLDLVERDNIVAGTIACDEVSFRTSTNTEALVASRVEHLQGLFDRIAQASGRARSEAVEGTIG